MKGLKIKDISVKAKQGLYGIVFTSWNPSIVQDLLKETIQNEFPILFKKSNDEQTLITNLKITARSFLKEKFGLKPVTNIEIVRI